MHKLGIVLVIILGALAALWLGGAGMLGFGGFGMDSGMMSGVVTTIAPIYLTLIVGAGVVIILLMFARTPKHAAVITDGSALEITKSRYAKGEITKAQYDGIKHDLGA